MCSPSFRTAHGIRSVSDLQRVPLLHQINRPTAWGEWFTAQELTPPETVRGPRFEHIHMLAAAAMAGLGVALLPGCLTERERAAGMLTILPSRAEHRGIAYYLVVPEAKRMSPRVRAFQDWIVGAARDAKNALRRRPGSLRTGTSRRAE